jgi:hypothetical protein
MSYTVVGSRYGELGCTGRELHRERERERETHTQSDERVVGVTQSQAAAAAQARAPQLLIVGIAQHSAREHGHRGHDTAPRAHTCQQQRHALRSRRLTRAQGSGTPTARRRPCVSSSCPSSGTCP